MWDRVAEMVRTSREIITADIMVDTTEGITLNLTRRDKD